MSWVVTLWAETEDLTVAEGWRTQCLSISPGATVDMQEHIPYVPEPDQGGAPSQDS